MVHQNLKQIETLNTYLKNDHFCVPPYNSINGSWTDAAFTVYKKNDNFIGKITSEIILPWRRAYQSVYRYRELEIFKNFYKIIDFSTVAYFQGNSICSYLSLCPVIEGLLLEWHKEDTSINWRGVKKFSKEKLDELKSNLNDAEHHDSWLILMCEYLNDVLNDIFYLSTDNPHSNIDSIQDGFNRHLTLHMKNPTNWQGGLINTIRLFLIIDIIAELYYYANFNQYKKLHAIFDLNYNPDLCNMYWELYKQSANDGLYDSKYNRLLNQFYNSI